MAACVIDITIPTKQTDTMKPTLHRSRRHGLALGTLTIGVLAIAAYAASNDPSFDPPSTSRKPPPFDANGHDDSFLAAVRVPDVNKIVRGEALLPRLLDLARNGGASSAVPDTGDPIKGTFSPVLDWPLIGIHAVLTPEGRVLSYGSDANGTQSGLFVYDVWDPELGLDAASHQLLPNNTNVDIFCSAQLLLPNGDVEIYGGDVTVSGRSTNAPNAAVTLYRPIDDSLTRTGTMNRERWYATATTLPNGEVYIQGGTGGADYPEVRGTDGRFRLLTSAPTDNLASGYPRNFVNKDGKIFGIANKAMYEVDPNGAGTITARGSFPTDNIGGTSSAVMFAPDRILQVGGGIDRTAASRNVSLIDISTGLPKVTALPPMQYARQWGNATVMPDGRVFVSGGSAVNNVDDHVAYTSEIYDPRNNTWTLGATAKQMRLYHSTSLLLPDATILTMGGGAPGPQRNLNAEIYYPPYLFDAQGRRAPRPTILSAPMTVRVGQQIVVGTPQSRSISRVVLIKAGSVTHSFDMDQRFLELPFSAFPGTLKVDFPAQGYQTPPGFYLLFVIDKKGVPSKAAMLRINPQ